ncbi:MAG TPA: hypothetical protein VEZ72_06575 [Paenibacillus sp.]|nr:hypothetical protein [Paenibacillus sp.]
MVDRKKIDRLAKRALELNREQQNLLNLLLSNRKKLRNDRSLLTENLSVLKALKAQLTEILKKDGSS